MRFSRLYPIIHFDLAMYFRFLILVPDGLSSITLCYISCPLQLSVLNHLITLRGKHSTCILKGTHQVGDNKCPSDIIVAIHVQFISEIWTTLQCKILMVTKVHCIPCEK